MQLEKFNQDSEVVETAPPVTAKREKFYYDNAIVRNFAFATIIWGVVGMLAGLWVALQLVFPKTLNLQPWFNFGRLRPLHTNAVIFAFVGNGIFMGYYYSLFALLRSSKLAPSYPREGGLSRPPGRRIVPRTKT